MIRFACPSCSKQLKAGDESAGKKVKCSTCGQLLIVPTGTTKPSQSALSAPANSQPQDMYREDARRVAEPTVSDDYRRVRRACEASRDAALMLAAEPMVISAGRSEANEICEKAWREAFSGFSGRSLDLSGTDLSDMAFAWCGQGKARRSKTLCSVERT